MMTWALAGAVASAAALAASPPPYESKARVVAERYRTPAEAIAVALATRPAVVAFGEYHQTASQKEIPSALRRFTEQIFPIVATGFTHLVLETWISTGRCGEAERAATEEIPRTTSRPATTEREIETLIREAVRLGVRPRILTIGCDQYQAMRASQPGAAGLDYDRVLRVTEQALEVAGLAALEERRRDPRRGAPSWFGHPAGPPEPAEPPKSVAVYGGALHNDVHPEPGLAAYSFAPRLMAATLGRFIEIDLVVPEYARDNAALRGRTWWPLYLRTRRGRDTVLVRTGPASFVMIFPAGITVTPPTAPRP